MYVWFGFSLACLSRARTVNLQCQSLSLRRAVLLRSVCLSCVSACRLRARFRRARTIDLQWQSLSLRRAFLLHSVSVSAPNRRESSRLLANSLAKSIEKHIENRLKIDPQRRPGAPKIDSKSLPGPFRAPRDPPELTGRSSGSSRRARMAAKRAPREPSGDPKGAPGQLPGRPRSGKNGRGERFSMENSIAPFSIRFFIVFSSFFDHFWTQNRGKSHSYVVKFSRCSANSRLSRKYVFYIL